jgi:hypothetical protein
MCVLRNAFDILLNPTLKRVCLFDSQAVPAYEQAIVDQIKPLLGEMADRK